VTASGLRGRLVSGTFASEILPTLAGVIAPPADLRRTLDQWGARRERAFGPASGVRAIADGLIIPLLRLLGFDVLRRADAPVQVRLDAVADARTIPVIVVDWEVDLSRAWRDAVLAGIAADARWCICSNGRALRICDSHRTWSRDYLEFDFDVLPHAAELQAIFWALLNTTAIAATPCLLDQVVESSARHGVDTCRGLGSGVLASLQLLLQAMGKKTRGQQPEQLLEQALTIVYRVLFLLFAEARALVPIWHPVYRDRYTIEALVSTLVAGQKLRGGWQAIQAISRLAHAGCAAGDLRVTAFNGRLFSPTHAAAFDRCRVDDEAIGAAVLAVSTTNGPSGRTRIRYRDLDVEQLGAVYEQVLEYEARSADGELTRNRETRKASGTFYTPRQVTAHLVRETLGPLIEGRSAADILDVRVLDPAMGSGAFLVGACRFLAHAVEDALIREGRWHPADITASDRSGVRREIAQRCLFGVDLNPVAVQLARLSLWLATLAADRPLTFLDHHLCAGNSLVGATFEDLARQPGGGRRAKRRTPSLPLFDDDELARSLRASIEGRLALARQPDDTALVVRDKERQLAALHGDTTVLGRWKRVLDLWCAGWFVRRDMLDAAIAGELSRLLLTDTCALPATATAPLLRAVATVAGEQRFFHWPTAFPEVFRATTGEVDARCGFDAVIGNPPWDMVRGDSGDSDVRGRRKDEARDLTDFVREAGIYRVESRSHVNRYALFLERALQLTRPGGRIGLVLPAGVVGDVGAAPLRRHLFDRVAVDAVTGLDNRHAIFPIHRSVRFVLLTGTTGKPTSHVRCRFGVLAPEELDAPAAPGSSVELTRAFLARASGPDDLGVPDIRSERDLRILERITASVPCLGEADGWNVRFGRELNASDDRGLFVPRDGNASARPIVEGKQIEPFRTAVDRSRYQLRDGAECGVPRRSRLAYRDVASATNRTTLIAAVIPARAVTTHTLFCLKTPLPLDAQSVLCALFNSFVANYLMRLRVNTHVTTALVSRLRVPAVARGGPAFHRLHALSQALATAVEPVEAMEEYTDLQALVARLYGLTRGQFEHVTGTFPLIPVHLREAAVRKFDGVQ
jgi:hypothetical protein